MLRSLLLLASLLAAIALVSVHADSAVTSSSQCPADKPLAMCFRDPCQGVTTCPDGCESDYCGGCFARCRCRYQRDCRAIDAGKCKRSESGFGVCTGVAPAEDRCMVVKCSAGHHCVDGQCVPDQLRTCATMLCPVNTRCENAACIPLRCNRHRQCPTGSYCGSEGECLLSGECDVVADCARDPTLIRPLCLAEPTCIDRQCGFGPCQNDLCSRMRCRAGTHCVDGACVPDTTDDASCAATTCPVNTFCKKGECFPLVCSAKVPCAAGFFCSSTSSCLAVGTCNVAADCANDSSLERPKCSAGEKTPKWQWTCCEGHCKKQHQ